MNPQAQMRVIEQWMTQISQDGGIARYDDLHLDAINPRWKDRELWAEASSSTFQSGVEVRNRLKLPYILGLVVSIHPRILLRSKKWRPLCPYSGASETIRRIRRNSDAKPMRRRCFQE
jgi:hypothetical protein